MKVRIDKRLVDVAYRDCGKRDCFVLGFDKGSFSQGRGYTSYHRDAKGRRVERAVCGTRHYHGCPIHSVCPTCRAASVDRPGAACRRSGCDGVTVERST